MPDAQSKPPSPTMTTDDTITIHGREITLSTGAKVWGGLHEGSTVWKFESKDGGITRVTLSREAVEALVQIYQGLVCCDSLFVGVSFAPSGSDPTVRDPA